MILDFEQELSASGGQLFNASDGNAEYGSRPYDLMATGIDAAVGEPLNAFARVDDANSDVGTSLDLEIVNDTDGAGGSEVSMIKKSAVLVAALTQNSMHYIGTITPSQCALQYLTAKITTHGSAATAGKLKIWLQKASDGMPVNVAQP